ncbi:protease [Pedobacter ginsengisoli]|uniref:protease n=1 Tax=Pedobacter ginsengisoli TaxID=363852 RepID=UPI00254FC5AB|nr:protease [Pedobacter ginsengisoli]
MKNILITAVAATLLLSACGSTSKVSDGNSDSVAVAKDTSLTAILRAGAEAKLTDSVKVGFIVYNHTDSVRRFCKWHTPFEPLMSKYLDVIAADGTEAQYQGPMAKRMMPPPADSYISVQPGDSLAVQVNVSKGYQITKPGKYIIKYNGSGLSGITVKDSVTIDVK